MANWGRVLVCGAVVWLGLVAQANAQGTPLARASVFAQVGWGRGEGEASPSALGLQVTVGGLRKARAGAVAEVSATRLWEGDLDQLTVDAELKARRDIAAVALLAVSPTGDRRVVLYAGGGVHRVVTRTARIIGPRNRGDFSQSGNHATIAGGIDVRDTRTALLASVRILYTPGVNPVDGRDLANPWALRVGIGYGW